MWEPKWAWGGVRLGLPIIFQTLAKQEGQPGSTPEAALGGWGAIFQEDAPSFVSDIIFYSSLPTQSWQPRSLLFPTHRAHFRLRAFALCSSLCLDRASPK